VIINPNLQNRLHRWGRIEKKLVLKSEVLWIRNSGSQAETMPGGIATIPTDTSQSGDKNVRSSDDSEILLIS
jgi:hypothetical protein